MHTLLFIVGAALCFLSSFILIKKEPRQIINGFLLETGILLVIWAFVVNATNGSLIYSIVQVSLYIYNILILLLGIVLIIDSVMVIKKEGLSIPNVLPFVFGVLNIIVAYAGYMDITGVLSGSKIYVIVMSVLNNIVLYVPFAFGAFLIYSIVYALLKKNKSPDYIIILGCGLRKDGTVTPLLRDRVDKAIKWYKNGGEKAKFVVSGGQGADEVISEAQAMKNYLISQGISEQKILMEDKSVSTKENLLFSKKCIENVNCDSDILICTSNYHALRAAILARSLGINSQCIGGHTAFYYLPVAFLREYIAVIFRYKLFILIYIVLAVAAGIIL